MRFVVTASLLLLTAAPAHAQIAAAVVAPGNNGVLQLDENGRGVFAVVAINLGRESVVGARQPTGQDDVNAATRWITQNIARPPIT